MNKQKIIQYLLYPVVSIILSLLFCVLWIIVRNFWYLKLSQSELEDMLANFIPAIVIILLQIYITKIMQMKWFEYTLGKIGFRIFSTLFMIISLCIIVYFFLAAPFA